MSFSDTWRSEVPISLTTFKVLLSQTKGIDPLYGLFSAALLWPVREALSNNEQCDSICEVCGGKEAAKPILNVLRPWQDSDAGRITAAHELADYAASTPALKTALDKVLDRYSEFLQEQQFITLIGNSVSGGVINIGGNQYNYGPIVVNQTIVQQLQISRVCPTPPREPDHFGGRNLVLKELCARVKSASTNTIIAVHGLGGIGKTTLVRKIANDLYKDKTFRAVLWADVGRAPDPEVLLLSWATRANPNIAFVNQTIEQFPYQVKALLEDLIGEQCESCEPERSLVVLNDVWDDVGGRGKEIARLLRQASPDGATILITTRSENLAIDLAATTHSLDRLNGDDGVQLLQTYYPDGDPVALWTLVDVLGGHTLALILAIRRVLKSPDKNKLRVLSEHIVEYKKRLPAGDTIADLKLDQGDTKEDNLTLALSYSYDDLSDSAKARFRMLGVLPIDMPFDTGILSELWTIAPENADDDANKLRLSALLDVDPKTSEQYGGNWFVLHPLLRSYARALLHQNGEYESIWNRYVDYSVKLTAKFNVLPPESWNQLAPYLPMIHTVGPELVEKSKDTTDESVLRRAQSFAINMSRYLDNRHDVHQLDWLQMGLETSRRLIDQIEEARFLNEIGLAYAYQGDQERALGYYSQSLYLQRLQGNKTEEARVLSNIGGNYAASGNQEQALRYYGQALELRQVIGDRLGAAATLSGLGKVYLDLEEKERALEFFQQALFTFQQEGDRGKEATTLNNIGGVFSNLGEHQQALNYYERALSLTRVLGDFSGEAAILNNIGKTYSDLSDRQRALNYYWQALSLCHASRNIGGEATTLSNIGTVYLELGEPQQALGYLEQALPLSRMLGDRKREADALNSLGGVYDRLDQKRRALEYYKQALPLFRAVSSQAGEGAVLNNIGGVYADLNDFQVALEYYEQARLIFQRSNGDLHGQATTLASIGSVYLTLREPQRALDFCEQALPLFQSVNDRDGEATTYYNIGQSYYLLGNLDAAITHASFAVKLADLSEHADREQFRFALTKWIQQYTLPADQIDFFVNNSIEVKTVAIERLMDWRLTLERLRDAAADRGVAWQIEVAFAEALIAILDDHPVQFSVDNPYASQVQHVLSEIQQFKTIKD